MNDVLKPLLPENEGKEAAPREKNAAGETDSLQELITDSGDGVGSCSGPKCSIE